MKLVLPFEDEIPDRFSKYFDDDSPRVEFEDVPEEAETVALIMDDPDAPVSGAFTHWVIWNIPKGEAVPENIPREKRLENGARQGETDYGDIGYGGPRPPSGTHGYRFKAYAVDTELDLAAGASKQQLLDALEGHVIEEDEVTADYTKP